MTQSTILTAALVALIGFSSDAAAAEAAKIAPKSLWVFIGTYTGGKSKGIYVARLDLASGKLSEPVLAGESKNPSFLTIHPNGRYLYCANELWDKPAGAVSAFAIDRDTGKLTKINEQPSAGKGACFVSVDPSGKNALVANYGSGTVAVLPINEDGSLKQASAMIQHTGKGPDPKRQEGPHAHSINLDPAGRFAFACDLGLDKIFIYRFDAATGTLAPNDPPHAAVAGGAGPRHFSFHPNGTFAYVINEMGCTITAFSYDAQRGSLSEIQTIGTLPADFKGQNTTAEVLVHPSGKFVYGSNRGHDSIAIYAVDENSGKLTLIGHESSGGRTPRNFRITPDGAYLIAAHQSSESIVLFKIDQSTGRMQPTGTKYTVGSPVCVKFLAAEGGVNE